MSQPTLLLSPDFKARAGAQVFERAVGAAPENVAALCNLALVKAVAGAFLPAQVTDIDRKSERGREVREIYIERETDRERKRGGGGSG